jgi:hypothetical protein
MGVLVMAFGAKTVTGGLTGAERVFVTVTVAV